MEIDADVYVSVEKAIDEETLRRPIGHIEHYFVDVMTGSNEAVQRITTESLQAEEVSNFSAYEAKKELRYCHQYLSKILWDAISTLE